MKILCISGKAQHGKDTTALMLQNILDKNGKKTLIAHNGDLLKYICKTFFGWNGEKDDTGRTLLQYVGTDVVRKQYPDFWVDFLINIFTLFKNEWDVVIIPDCRFPNEIDKLKLSGLDTYHIRVERANFESPLSVEQQHHISETALDNTTPDILIQNDGDLDLLYNKVNTIVNNFI